MHYSFTIPTWGASLVVVLALLKARDIVGAVWRNRAMRPHFHWDRGWPCQPHRDPSWKTGHKYDWQRDLQSWPWWKLGFDLVSLGVTPPARGWGFWIYSRRGGRRIDFYLINRRVPATI